MPQFLPAEFWVGGRCYWAGPNDGAARRGDRADTGDNVAAPDDFGSDLVQPNPDSSPFGATNSVDQSDDDRFDVEQDKTDYNPEAL